MPKFELDTPESLLRLASSVDTRVFEMLHTGIALLSREGNFLYANKAYMEMYNLTNEVLGRHVSEFFLTSEQGVMNTIRTRKMTLCWRLPSESSAGTSFSSPSCRDLL